MYRFLRNLPAVYDLYLKKAKSQDRSFQFTITDNELFFSELLVLFPRGFDIAAFDMLIKDKKMNSFSILSVRRYAFDVNVILLLLQSQLKSINTLDLLERCFDLCVSYSISKFLQKRLPPSQTQFLSYIDQSSKLFDHEEYQRIWTFVVIFMKLIN